MKVIKILGADGCSTCDNLKKTVERIVEEKSIDAGVIKVTDVMDIMKYGVMSTPAVVVDEQLKCIGRVPTDSEIINWIV